MLKVMLTVSIGVMLLSFTSAEIEQVSERVSDQVNKEVIKLQRWQSCAGCRAAVESFSSRVFPVINEAIEAKGETAKMDLAPYMDGMCQTPAFQHYKEFVEHGKWIV
jgi:hypothetical protein